MNKEHRNSVDVEVAFASGAKRVLEKSLPPRDIPAVAETKVSSSEEQPETGGRDRGFLQSVRHFFRKLGKRGFKPPSLRKYMTSRLERQAWEIHAGTMQEIQRAATSLLSETQTVKEALLRDAQQIHAMNLRELRRISAGLLQEFRDHAAVLDSRMDTIERHSYTSARRAAINCETGEVLIKAAAGYILCSSSDHAVLACLLDTGEMEPGTRILIQRVLHPGDAFVDIGANLGLHTIAAAKAMQGRGLIFAFEPFEATCRLLEKSVLLNGFQGIVRVHQEAVSDKPGRKQLFLGSTSGHHSLFPLDVPGGAHVEVPAVRLDSVVQLDQKVDLIKIDAEGAELEILEGAAAVIKNNLGIALIVEFGPAHLRRSGHSPEQWLAAFTSLGLCYRAINAATGALEEWSLDQLKGTESINLFFARPDSNAWTKAQAIA